MSFEYYQNSYFSMKYQSYILLSFLLFVSHSLFAQKNVTISGYVRDSVSSENLYNATVFEQNSKQGTVSNAYGFFSFAVPAGQINIVISYVGYKQQYVNIKVTKDTLVNIKLISRNDIPEVVVSAKEHSKIRGLPGHEQITMQSVEALPGFLGEQDVLKSLTVMPGVQQGYEGSAGLFVRGGSPDQNLILLDGVPVYNASHLFGFVSVFTPEALQSVDFYKGSFPVRYGGRLSSVVDVRMKEGNKNARETNLTVGLVSSKFTHEGPIKKGKSSYLVSARRTLLDLLVTNVARLNKVSSDEETVVPGLSFHDINLKLNFDLNPKNRLYISLYTGGDRLFSRFSDVESYEGVTSKQKTKVDLAWGNKIGAVRWNSQIGNKLFLNTTLSSGLFRYNIHNNYKLKRTEDNEKEEQWTDIKYKTLVNNNKLQFLFDWYLNNSHKMQFGIDAQANWFVPGKQKISRSEGRSVERGNSWISNNALAFFADDHLIINDKLAVYGGLRLEEYIMNSRWDTYLLPRISIQVSPSPRYNISLSYDEMAQPIHLLTNSSIGLPSDIWVPATINVPPEFSKQMAFGFHMDINRNLNYSFDSYYKTMDGVINYKAGYSFMDIYDDWESMVEIGTGKAWGFENALNYEDQHMKTWLNYTLAWNKRRFDHINDGEEFPFKFDRRHDVNLGVVYKFSEQLELSAMWVFQTGQAATVPQQDYHAAGEIDYRIYDFITSKSIEDPDRIQYIEAYNQYRLPAFHHLDVGLTFKRQWKSFEREWKLGIYNIYARQNPYMYYPYTTRDGYRKYKQISIFPFVPSISYHIRF